MKVDRIKRLIILMFILIILTIIIIIVCKNREKDNIMEQEVAEFDEGLEYEENSEGFTILNDPNVFFSIIDSLETYFDILKFDIQDKEYTGHYEIENEEDMKKLVIKMLDEEYVEKNDINIKNFNRHIELMNYGYNIIPVDLRVKYSDNITTYVVKVYIEKMETNELKEKYYIVRVDSKNSTFSIEPVEGSVDNIDSMSVKDSFSEIESFLYNKFSIQTISMEQLVKTYMNSFLKILLNHTDIAYENYLETEYKEKRFGTLEKFKEYVDVNREELKKITPKKYLFENEDEYKKYVILDQYEDTFEFYETATMTYKVRLDNYTIISDKFKTTYDSSSEQYKVAMNIDKWIKMLNTRDYSHAYELLDETFRNNNWGSEENFEEDMRQKLPLHYKVEYSNFSKENSTYIQQINLSDITGETEDIVTINIIMQLKEDYEFVMSFNIEE